MKRIRENVNVFYERLETNFETLRKDTLTELIV